MIDKLETMMQAQARLDNLLCPESPDKICVAMLQEVSELLDETAWKWWKTKEEDRSKQLEELVDVIHFVLSFANMQGFTSKDLFNAYLKKNQVNVERHFKNITKEFLDNGKLL